MPARYYPAHGPDLIVELWEEGKGFALELCYEADYQLRDGSIEALTVDRAARSFSVQLYFGGVPATLVLLALTGWLMWTQRMRPHADTIAARPLVDDRLKGGWT